MFITSNVIACVYFLLLVFEFKLDYRDKYFINDIIEKVIDQFCVK